ncbi:MAG: hypothetical protein HYS12_02485 [Planctomycetes bacterium]|nr:hypothetical protein [Planctomycetota bacterium]
MSANETPEPTVIVTPSQLPTGRVSITLANLPVGVLKKYASPKPLRRPQPLRKPSSEEKG